MELAASAAARRAVDAGMAETIVGRALLGIGEDRIGLVDLLEPAGRFLAPAIAVGVVLHGELTERRLERSFVRAPFHAEDLVIIPHAMSEVQIDLRIEVG